MNGMKTTAIAYRTSALGLLALLTACNAPQTWVADTNSCQLTSSATIGGKSANWTGCRVHFDGPDQIATFELMTPGTTGSFALPGPGWLSLSVALASPQNATLSVDDSHSDLPTTLGDNSISIFYFPTGGGEQMAVGSTAVGNNGVDPNAPGAEFSANLSGVSLQTASGPVALGGNFSLAAGAAISSSGGSAGGGTSGSSGSSGSGSSSGGTAACQGLVNQCSSCGTCQAPCYCAAACDCHYSGDSSCEQSNRASAQQLGTTCSY